ncbi:MAG: TIM barrel protein, partial [Sedimentisphaerales bacterium]
TPKEIRIMRIKYVVSTMVFWGRQNRLSLEQECEFLKSMGFGVELWPNTGGIDECSYDRRNWPRLTAATEGMLVSMRSRNDNPSIEQWAEQIECAKLLKSNIIADLQSLRIQSSNSGNGDFLGEVVSIADNEGVKLCMETGPLDVLKEIGDRFHSIWYCLDTGFASNDDGHGFRDYVDALADKTAHLHLAESFNGFDSHRPLGCRCGIPRQDWDYLLKALSKNNHDVIGAFEMTPCTPAEMIHRSSHFLFDVLKWPNQPKKSAKHIKTASKSD